MLFLVCFGASLFKIDHYLDLDLYFLYGSFSCHLSVISFSDLA